MSKELPAVTERWVDTRKLDAARFNPEPRTKVTALLRLKEDIAKNGILSELHVCKNEDDDHYTIIDGHRRTQCAIDLGIEKIRCAVHDCRPVDFPRLWATLNKNTRGVSGREWLCFWYALGQSSEKHLPPTTRNQIRRCVEILGGRDEVGILVEKGTSPSIVSWVDRLIMKCNEKRSLAPSLPSAKAILLWMLKHRTQQILAGIVNGGQNPSIGILRKVITRIKRDMPLTLADLAARSLKDTDVVAVSAD